MSGRTIVLGAGPAGLGAALQLARRKLSPVTVIEQHQAVGGTAGSFVLEGVHVDYGSHRLHHYCDPKIMADLQQLLGEDLLLRPRHGRIRLLGKWVHFPLLPLDLATHLPLSFPAGIAWDIVSKRFAPTPSVPTFQSVLQRGLGTTICRDFYFPYTRKIWGVDPALLSPELARRRVSGNSPGKMLRALSQAIPGFRPATAGKFFYPRRGYGQISERLAEAVRAEGGELLLGSRVTRVEKIASGWRVSYDRSGEPGSLECGRVWSTLPVTALTRSMTPAAPSEVLQAGSKLKFRAMILIYLVLEQARFTEFDAHYFPEEAVPLSRLSEPKNYSASIEPSGVTVLCGELPCDIDSDLWKAGDWELGDAMAGWLASVDLPIRSSIRRVMTRRLPQAYPIYFAGYETHFDTVDRWLGGLADFLSFGRQGLFAHDNLHHALYMGYSAADCLRPDGTFDDERWAAFRREFTEHVVVD